MRVTWVWSLAWDDPLEKEMVTHSSTLAWRIPWMEEPGRLQSMGSQRIRHNSATSLHFFKEIQCQMNWHTFFKNFNEHFWFSYTFPSSYASTSHTYFILAIIVYIVHKDIFMQNWKSCINPHNSFSALSFEQMLWLKYYVPPFVIFLKEEVLASHKKIHNYYISQIS